jgi:hypothetical protein
MRFIAAMLFTLIAAAPAIAESAPIEGGQSDAAQDEQISPKEAFEAAKELGTRDAWQAYVANFPRGFYADLARAYVKNLGGEAASLPGPAPNVQRNPTGPAPATVAQPTQAPERGRANERGPNADLGGARLLPDDSPWHRDISKDPVDPNSRRILTRVGLDKPLRADFGSEWEGKPIGIPYVVIGKTQPKVPVTFTEAADESDPGPYPVPPDAPVEGGPDGDGDRHVLVLDRDTRTLWELFNAFPDGKGGWKAGSGAVWDLTKNQARPAGWTSADAAGLPILPGLVRYDEAVGAKVIAHALRFTLAKTRRAYVPPASHWASEVHDEDLAPMGMRVRLRASYDLSGFAPEVRAILQALKTFGMIVADNGSDNFISGAPDERWNNDTLRQLMRVKTRDLEVVAMKDLVADTRRR